MLDYEFGKRLRELRKLSGYSQEDIAHLTGVTNKAVSKWEMGYTKPSIEILKQLSKLYNIKIDELLNNSQKNERKNIQKIVITGGPCAGKTTAMSWIQNFYSKQGYDIVFIPETATELISSGIAPWTCKSNIDYQRYQMLLQLSKENIYYEAAQKLKNNKVLIVCDRGLLDNKAYMEPAEFNYLLNELKTNEIELRDNYDAVFHLVTAAKGAEEFYTTENNTARKESVEEARMLDDKIISSWTGHPHFRVIENTGEFKDKISNLLSHISSFLGEPEPYEIERKYLIEYPNIKWLENNPNCNKVNIVQTYLKNDNDEEVRIRRRGIDGNYIYYMTTKREISKIKRVEIEKRLTEREYLDLLMNVDNHVGEISKTRYCLTYNGIYYEIDIFPFCTDKALLEIELRSEDEKIVFPQEINVIKEVTEDDNYKNFTLAKRMKL